MFFYSNYYLNNTILILKNHVLRYPTPFNFNYLYNFGFISFFFLLFQILTGIFLAMHYCSDVTLAFQSIEHIMRNVNYGWFIRYWHTNGASFFFLCVYIHIFRGLYFKSYKFLNIKIWWTGLLIFILMMGISFIGYVLPWGQMSFWGATVITSMVSALPIIGTDIVCWVWGGFSVSGPTLSRFFSLHYFLPFILFFFVLLHIIFLHLNGSSNPSFISEKINRGYLALYSNFVLKDLVGLLVFIFLFFYFIVYFPNFLGHSDNYIKANPLLTPEHIVPEWYFLPFYAILRAIPNKLLGVAAMAASLLIFFFLPLIDFFKRKFIVSALFLFSPYYSYFLRPIVSWFFFMVFLLLGWLGAQPAEEPFTTISLVLTFLYFFLILIFGFVF